MIGEIFCKIRKQNGTTLVETLATVVLIGIMGVALTAGIGTVRNTYGRIIRRANEQVLLSTTITEMRNLIHNAVEVVEYNGEPCFKSHDGYWFQFKKDDGSGDGIKINYLEKDIVSNGFSPVSSGVKLLTKEVTNKNLYSTFNQIKLGDTNEYVEISGLAVKCLDESAPDFELKYEDGSKSYFVSWFGE